MEPLAYGMLGLTPREFAAMTPREFAVMAEAVSDHRNEEREFAASLILPFIQIFTKKQKTLDSLLGGAYTAWRLRREQRRHEQRISSER